MRRPARRASTSTDRSAVAAQAERDHYEFLHRHTAARVLRSCAGEMEREVYAVLGPVGVDERLSRQVARCLRKVEVDSGGAGAARRGGSEEDAGLRWSTDVGLTAFLLKFGEGIGGWRFAPSTLR